VHQVIGFALPAGLIKAA